MFDTCNCEKSEDCLCAALSSYVRACAAKGVLLSDWREGICGEYAVGKQLFFCTGQGPILGLIANWMLQGSYSYVSL